eukprot:4634704-Amphidinium_carterae.1
MHPHRRGGSYMNLKLHYFQEIVEAHAIGSLLVHRISHITMLITLCCTLPRHRSTAGSYELDICVQKIQ